MALTRKEISDRFYQRRKENGLCVRCGKPIDREGVMCVSCRKIINKDTAETRKWLQEHGICPRCRKNFLYGDEKNCPECAAYSYSIIMPKREENREHYNEIHKNWSRKTHHRMIEMGVCTRCRKRKADAGYKTCGMCREKTRRYKQSRNITKDRSEREKNGLCYFCDNPIKQGYKVCEMHYKMNVENARSARANNARKNLIKQGVLY